MKTEYLVTVRSLDGKPSTGLPYEIPVTICDLFQELAVQVARYGTGVMDDFMRRQGGWEVTVSRYYPSDADKDTEHGSGQEEANQ